MKTQSVSSLIALASTLQVAAATGFGSGGLFSCPSNTNNECNPQQNSGYDWSSLPTGKPVTSYGGMNFNGWGCANSFGKRDPLAKRTFANSKCITGTAHSDKSKASTFSCGANTDVKKFSVTEMHVSVEFDCMLDFHFDMPDKSTCKQTSGCSTGGSIVKNSQCGGATGVTIVYPPTKGQNNGKGKDSCSIGVHSIGFDCNPAQSTSTRSSSTVTKASVTKATTTAKSTNVSSSAAQTTSSTSPAKTGTSVGSTASASTASASTSSLVFFGNSSTIAIPSSSGFVTVTSSTAAGTTEVASTTSAAASSSVVGSASTGSSAAVTSSAASSVATPSVTLPVESSVAITTVVAVTTLTTCPFTSTHTSAGTTSVEVGTTVSTITVSSTVTSTVCTRCTAVPTGTGVTAGTTAATTAVVESSAGVSVTVSSAVTPAGPAPTAPGVPETLPKCMNTWNFMVGCLDNTDHACYCPSTEFVNNVFECLSAYGADDKAVQEAAKYFQGICAPYIPQNPAIVTACPGNAPPAATTAVSVTGAPSVGVTAVPSVPGVPSIESPGVTAAPATTVAPVAPGGPAAPGPVTTISYSTTITVPCVESTGVSSGLVIPSSSTTTAINTVITVPQVVFSTPTAAPAGTATAAVPVLVVGTPAAVPAETTAVSDNSGASATTIATVPVAAPSASNGTSGAAPTAPLLANSGSSTGVAFGSIMGAALFAIFAL